MQCNVRHIQRGVDFVFTFSITLEPSDKCLRVIEEEYVHVNSCLYASNC